MWWVPDQWAKCTSLERQAKLYSGLHMHVYTHACESTHICALLSWNTCKYTHNFFNVIEQKKLKIKLRAIPWAEAKHLFQPWSQDWDDGPLGEVLQCMRENLSWDPREWDPVSLRQPCWTYKPQVQWRNRISKTTVLWFRKTPHADLWPPRAHRWAHAPAHMWTRKYDIPHTQHQN